MWTNIKSRPNSLPACGCSGDSGFTVKGRYAFALNTKEQPGKLNLPIQNLRCGSLLYSFTAAECCVFSFMEKNNPLQDVFGTLVLFYFSLLISLIKQRFFDSFVGAACHLN